MGTHSRRILLAVDGSDQAFEAVRYISQLFAPERMEVVLFHALSKVPEGFWDMETDPRSSATVKQVRAWEVQQKKKIQAYMQSAR